MTEWKELYELIKAHTKFIKTKKSSKNLIFIGGSSQQQYLKIQNVNNNIKKLNEMFLKTITDINNMNDTNVSSFKDALQTLYNENVRLQNELEASLNEEIAYNTKMLTKLSELDNFLSET